MKLFRKIKSIIPTYQKHGIDGLLFAILKNLKINTMYVSIIEKKKFYIGKRIINLTNKEVINLQNTLGRSRCICKISWFL